MKIKLILLLLFFAAMLSAREVYFKHITREQGLSQLSAISIWQDSLGVIWFGNSTLNKYDGTSVEVFDLSRYTGSGKDLNIRTICGQPGSSLYMLADKEVIAYDLQGETIRPLEIDATAIAWAGNRLYYASGYRLHAYVPADSVHTDIGEIASSCTVRALFPAGEDTLFVAASCGVYRVDVRSGVVSRIADVTDGMCLFRDSGNRLWIGTGTAGVTVLYPDGTQKRITKENRPGYALSDNNIRCFAEDDTGAVWIGTYDGITVTDPVTLACSYLQYDMHADYTLRHNSVYAIYKDRQGTMWVGTYYGGLSYANPVTERYRFYPAIHHLPGTLKGTVVGNMHEDDAGNLYIGTEGGGISLLNRKSRKIDSLPLDGELLSHRTVKSLWYDAETGRLFIGTFKDGLLVYDKSTNRTHRIGDVCLHTVGRQIIQEILPYKNGLVLLTQEGLFRVDRHSLAVTPLFRSAALQERTARLIRAVYIDSDGLLWVSFVQDGLASIDLESEEMKEYGYPGKTADMPGSPVIHICGNGRGDLFIATLGSGIFRYDRASDRFVIPWEDKALSPLLSDICYKLAFTRQGNLLVTSDRGITLFEPGTGEARHIRLGKNFPLKGLLPNSGLYVSPSSGEMYVGGMYGLISLFESDLGLKNTDYTVYFSSLSVNNRQVTSQTDPAILPRAVSYAGEVRLNYDQNNVTFTFASSDYASSSYSGYEYKMEGFDSHWVQTPFKTLTYSSLPPGKYVFTVRETNDTARSASIRVSVTPPFYASVYAWVLYGLMVAVLLGWWVRANKSRALLKASLEMEHREKLRIEELNQAKLRFFTNISHEFRTPLTLITTQLDMIQSSGSLSPGNRVKLSRIRKHALRLQELITELLDFRKQENGKLVIKASRNDLNAFLGDVYGAFTDYARSKGIRYEFKHQDEPLEVWFDTVQMQKVFYNLLSNAFKFTPENGEVTLSLAEKDGMAEVTVTNIGSEIRADDRERIFDRFYQADNLSVSPDLPGSGIGLALSKGIVDSHRGRITVESGDNRTAFRIVLPLGEAHLQPEEKSVAPVPVVHGRVQPDVALTVPETTEEGEKCHTILIVEDNADLLNLLKEAFAPVYRVVEAHDGEEGLRLAHVYMPNLVLSDIRMPRLAGTEMCLQLKKHIETSHIPVILLTARSLEEQRSEGLKCGADDYISK
ncbi:MAG: response regulator, partial [Parabacteroides sp.]|nr:response regulator [Parabacteroides sp.]